MGLRSVSVSKDVIGDPKRCEGAVGRCNLLRLASLSYSHRRSHTKTITASYTHLQRKRCGIFMRSNSGKWLSCWLLGSMCFLT